MAVKTINTEMLTEDVPCRSKPILKQRRRSINELNVFPVPDGDTGTNMTLTIMSAAKEVKDFRESELCLTIAKAISSGSLERCPRKFRRHPFPASSEDSQKRSVNMMRSDAYHSRKMP